MNNAEWQEERKALIKAQEDYCKEHECPMFAPPNGMCWSCNHDCVNEKWRYVLITGCSRCMRSFVD